MSPKEGHLGLQGDPEGAQCRGCTWWWPSCQQGPAEVQGKTPQETGARESLVSLLLLRKPGGFNHGAPTNVFIQT